MVKCLVGSEKKKARRLDRYETNVVKALKISPGKRDHRSYLQFGDSPAQITKQRVSFIHLPIEIPAGF